jgi:hypothetical protein
MRWLRASISHRPDCPSILFDPMMRSWGSDPRGLLPSGGCCCNELVGRTSRRRCTTL